MSLLRTLANSVLSGKGQQAGLASLVLQNPRLMQAAMQLLSKDSAVGGLPGLISRFQAAGLGDVVASWVGNGNNQGLSGAQVEQALGSSILGQLAGQANMSNTDASNVLAQALPVMIDRATPKGQAEALDTGGLQQMLGGFLKGKL